MPRELPSWRFVARAVAAFDAFNGRHPWSHNEYYAGWVVRQRPRRRASALDVGCGQGLLLRRLAPHFGWVHGIDVDAGMRAESAARCADLPHVTVDGTPLGELETRYDSVSMVSVLHHLGEEQGLTAAAQVLAPGGRLSVVGLARPASPTDRAWDLLGLLVNPVVGFALHPRADRGPSPLPPYPVLDAVLSFAEVREIVRRVLPGARIRRRLFFRYTVRWTHP